MNIQVRYLLAFVFPFFIGCSEQTPNKENETADPFRKNLFNPFYVDQILNTPNSFGSFWMSAHVKQLDIDKISIIMKGGNRADNILEKFIYTFNSKGQNDTFQYYLYNHSTHLLNETNFKYANGSLDKIDIIKYYQIGNLPPIKVYKDDEKIVFYKSRSNGKNDSIFFYPNKLNPKVIIDKIGNFNNSLEIIVPKGSSLTEIKKQLATIDSNLTHFELSEKLLTYTQDGMPIESYHIGENWNQTELAKQWEYNEYSQLIQFNQWLHGTKIKDIEIIYNENSLPKRIICNRKKYYLIYKKF